jgi:flagellum-specific peptidoglycan hydrolase FlgJ
MDLLESLKLLLSGNQQPKSMLTQKGKSSIGYYEPTRIDVKANTPRGNRMLDLRNFSGVADNWRDYRSKIDQGDIYTSTNGKNFKSTRKNPTNLYGNDIPDLGVGFGEPSDGYVIPKKQVESVLGASQPAKKGIQKLDDKTRRSYIQNFMKYNKGDAKYTQQWINSLLNNSPTYNLDPLTMLSIAALESGWGGTRHGNNLIGYGKTDSGDMGYNYENQSINDAVNSLLKEVSGAWGGVYTNQTSPQGFVSHPKYKWNYNDDWDDKVNGTMRLIMGR